MATKVTFFRNGGLHVFGKKSKPRSAGFRSAKVGSSKIRSAKISSVKADASKAISTRPLRSSARLKSRI